MRQEPVIKVQILVDAIKWIQRGIIENKNQNIEINLIKKIGYRVQLW